MAWGSWSTPWPRCAGLSPASARFGGCCAGVVPGLLRQTTLDLIDPGRVDAREVHSEPRVSVKLGHGGWALMCPIVVANDMHVQVRWDLRIDLGQELLERNGPVLARGGGDHGPAGHVQGREQACGAVPGVVMGALMK